MAKDYYDYYREWIEENDVKIYASQRMLTVRDKIACDHFETFFDLADYLEQNRICYRPGCTTCYCERFCQMAYYMGPDRMNEIIKASSYEEMCSRTDLIWHDAMEVLLNRHPAPVYIDKDLQLVKAYYEIMRVYRQAKAMHVGQNKIYLARQEVIRRLIAGKIH